jgi:hypothetical protein
MKSSPLKRVLPKPGRRRHLKRSLNMALKFDGITTWSIMLVCLQQIPSTKVTVTDHAFEDYELGRLLVCGGDVESGRTQLELVYSGKVLEVDASGKKVNFRACPCSP